MENIIEKLLKILRKQIYQNNEEIRINQEEISWLLSDKNNPELQKTLDEKQILNKEIQEENEAIIHFQHVIADFQEKYGHLFLNSDDSDEEIVGEQEGFIEDLEYFEETINGVLNFDQYHPQFNNPSFFEHLIKYYEEREDYEMCDKLMKMIKSH